MPVVCLEALKRCLTPIVNTGNCRTFELEEHLVVGPRTQIAITVHHLYGNECQALAIGRHRLTVGGESEMMGCPSSADGLFPHILSVLSCHDLHLSWFEDNPPHHMILMGICLPPYTLTAPVDIQLHLIGLVVIAPHVNGLAFYPVPVGEEVQHGLVGPLALIHIVGVLGEACQVDDAEITTPGGIGIRCGFADIIETCPDELSTHKIVVLHHVPCLLMRAAPRGMHVVVCAAFERWVGVG